PGRSRAHGGRAARRRGGRSVEALLGGLRAGSGVLRLPLAPQGARADDRRALDVDPAARSRAVEGARSARGCEAGLQTRGQGRQAVTHGVNRRFGRRSAFALAAVSVAVLAAWSS